MRSQLLLQDEWSQHDVVQAERLALECLRVVERDGDFRLGGDEHDVVEVAARDAIVVRIAAFFTLVDMEPREVLADLRTIAERDVDAELARFEAVRLDVVVVDSGELEAVCLARDEALGDLRDRADFSVFLGKDCERVADAFVSAPAVVALDRKSVV